MTVRTMNFKQETIRNMKITAWLQVFSKVLGTVTSIFLARLLMPSDFGIVAIVYLFLATINIFGDIGFGEAIIHRKESIDKAFNTGFTLNFISSGFLFVIAFVLAPLLAQFYDNSDLTLVTRVVAISILFNSFGFVPTTRLRKELKFGKMAIPDVVTNLSNSIIAIILAFFGFGYWSLIYGGLVSSVVKLLFLFKICPWKPKVVFDKQIAKELFVYGKYLFMANILVFIGMNIDDAVGGKMLGLTALGYYYFAYKWGNFSVRISGMSERVMFPTYSKMQGDILKIKRWYLKILKYVSIVAFPLSLGLFIVAMEFVVVILGEKWEPSVLPMRILCICGLFTSLCGTTGSVFTAIGKPKIERNISFINTAIIVVLIYPLTLWFELIGLSLAVTIAAVVTSVPTVYILCKTMDIKYREYFSSIKPAFISTSIAFIATALLKYGFGIGSYHLSNLIILIISFSVFSAVYLIVFIIFYKEHYIEILRLIRNGSIQNQS